MLSLLLASALSLQDAAPQDEEAMPATEIEEESEAPLPPPTDAETLTNQILGGYAAHGDFIADFAGRRARERILAELLLPVLARQDLDEGAHGEILAQTQPQIAEVESANTAWALAQLDPEDFIILYVDRPREATELLRWAARNPGAQARIVAALEPVALQGLYDGQAFAEMSDALAVGENRPQPYGTATECVDGRLQPWPIDETSAIDDRRQHLGLAPWADAWDARIAADGDQCELAND